jgi:hypothetical protein
MVMAGSSWLLVSAVVLPGLGAFLAGGAFAGLAGAAIGGGVGALASVGLHEEGAQRCAGAATAGRTLVAVRANARSDTAQGILRDHGAYDVEPSSPGAVANDPDAADRQLGRSKE